MLQMDRLQQLRELCDAWKLHHTQAAGEQDKTLCKTALDAIMKERVSYEALEGPPCAERYEQAIRHLIASARCWTMLLQVFNSARKQDRGAVSAFCTQVGIDQQETIHIMQRERKQVLVNLSLLAQMHIALLDILQDEQDQALAHEPARSKHLRHVS
jgi:hypothetical protein